jgi:serine/threonine-protein kinase
MSCWPPTAKRWLKMDTARNVYVASYGTDQVLELPAGWTAPSELPFSGLKGPIGVAVDTTGNVYVTDAGNNRVLKLPPKT